jgi:hypothetical protein
MAGGLADRWLADVGKSPDVHVASPVGRALGRLEPAIDSLSRFWKYYRVLNWLMEGGSTCVLPMSVSLEDTRADLLDHEQRRGGVAWRSWADMNCWESWAGVPLGSSTGPGIPS